jgi:hypothetical protein
MLSGTISLVINNVPLTYMTTGSIAGIIYGQHRITHDIDLVDELRSEQLPQLLAKLPPKEFYCPPEEVVRIMQKLLDCWRATLI